MSNCIYCKKNYKIIQMSKNNYLIINTDKSFENGHTHIYNYNVAKIIVYCCIKGEFPKYIKHLDKDERTLTSIIRICSNKYIRKFKDLLFDIQQKKEDAI